LRQFIEAKGYAIFTRCLEFLCGGNGCAFDFEGLGISRVFGLLDEGDSLAHGEILIVSEGRGKSLGDGATLATAKLQRLAAGCGVCVSV